MTNKEMVIEALDKYGCSTSKQLANLVHRDYGVTITPASAAAAIKPLVWQGKAASSKDDKGTTVYWLVK